MITATPEEYRRLMEAFRALHPALVFTGPAWDYRNYLDSLRRWINEEQVWPAQMVLADLDSSPHVERS